MVENTITCPKCGHSSAQADTCPKCGVIFSKIQSHRPSPPPNEIQETLVRQKKSLKPYVFGSLAALFSLASGLIYMWLFSPEVKVYVEGTFTEDEVLASVYMDSYISCLTSFGVKLIYHPDQLEFESAMEIDDYLYTGDEVIERYQGNFEMTPIELPYKAEPFESVYFMGNKPGKDRKTDTGWEGCITGKRLLIGEVAFNRVEDSMPFDPSLLFITFASGNNTSDPMRDFAKDIGRTSYRTGSSNVRLNGKKVKFGSITMKEAM